ncbi:sulfatase [Coraliomargarita sinensis]|uniref:Sulfatase n=1 Tax=Coraliomargarita sinensis TaxID=2174842 RepID=A0A317ZJJ6_9BACT|nr:sulfatase [Coraliomargarita sinensis]PXA04393.1 sulfatase [Coraliomargarita sinensis]
MFIRLFAFFFAVSLTHAAAEPQRPNILWIFSDDHTRQAIGAYGGRFADLDPTPNIDRIADQGIRFDRAYVGNSICAPARATLLTGKHSHIHGKTGNRGGFDHNQQQFQKILQKHDYQTAMIGKIHLSGKMQGFDYWDVLPGQGSYYQPEFISEAGSEIVEGYVADIITDKAIDWLEHKRDRDKPFMLMVHHKATHRTWMAAPRHVGLYDEVTLPEPDNLFDDYENRGIAAKKQDMTLKSTMRLDTDLKVRSEANKAKGFKRYRDNPYPGGESGAYFRMNDEQRAIWDAAYDPRNQAYFDADLEHGSRQWIRWAYQRYVKDYLRTAHSVDESVGALLDYLAANGLDKNTIVMYSSDQGFYLGEHGWFDKRFMYDESFSTPLLVSWPGVSQSGTVNSDLVQNIDFAETFLDLAGAPIPEAMQGRSLLPLINGERPDDWRDSLYYHYYAYPATHSVRRHEGVFDGRWKLIRFYGPGVPGREQWELFDLKKDPLEMNSIYEEPEHAEQIKRLKSELTALKEQYQVPQD